MHFDRNMGSLAVVDGHLADLVRNSVRGEDLALVPSKAGPPSLKAGGIALHSLYDPQREAREWVEHHREEIDISSGIVVLGFGLGYHVAELVRATEKAVTVFEPRIDVLRAALEASDLSDVLARARIVTRCEELAPGRMFRVLRHLPSIRSGPAPFAEAASRLDVLRVVGKGLRIAVVGPIYGGSLPIAGYCAAALRNLGHEVEFIDNGVYAESVPFHRRGDEEQSAP